MGDLAVRVSVGGWPGLLDLPIPEALMVVRGYLEETARADLVRVDVTVKVDKAVVTKQLGELRKNELAKEEQIGRASCRERV